MTLVDRYTFGSGEQVVLRMPDCSAGRSSTATGVPKNPTNLTEALAFFNAHSLPVTPVRRSDKKARVKGWSQPGHNAEPSVFRLDDNVGVLNGTQPTPGWFFHDVDLDANSDEARLIASRVLPPTGWRYGRPGKPESHYNYLAKEPLRTRKYSGADGRCVIELRGLTRKKTHTERCSW